MEERNIKIDINTAKKWYNGNDESLRNIALQAFTKEELTIQDLPNSWKEFCENYFITNEYYINDASHILCYGNKIIRDASADKNCFSDKKTAEACLAFIQLIRLRDVYRQGWKPNWKDCCGYKYVIYCVAEKIATSPVKTEQTVLSFQTREIRDKFLNNFEDLIEMAKDFI